MGMCVKQMCPHVQGEGNNYHVKGLHEYKVCVCILPGKLRNATNINLLIKC